MPDQFGHSDEDLDRGDWQLMRRHEDEYEARTAKTPPEDKTGDAPFVVIVRQLGNFPARPYYFRLEPVARQFAKETGGTLYQRVGD